MVYVKFLKFKKESALLILLVLISACGVKAMPLPPEETPEEVEIRLKREKSLMEWEP